MSPEMPTRSIGSSTIEASVVGLGTWAIGGWMWGGTDEADSVAAVQASLDEGVSLIDTAPAYGQGLAEEIVGKAIRGRRDKVVLATKCGLVWHTRQGNRFFDYDSGPVHRYLGRESIVHEVEQSLRRLGTDHIDLYITHWQDPTTPLEETIETLVMLKDQGKINSIGASNLSEGDLRSYAATGALDSDPRGVLDGQPRHRDDAAAIVAEGGISTLSYSSLALGLLSGTVGPERTFSGDDQRRDHPLFSPANRARVDRLMEAIAPVAEGHGATKAQVVIAWTLRQPGIAFALCGRAIPIRRVRTPWRDGSACRPTRSTR